MRQPGSDRAWVSGPCPELFGAAGKPETAGLRPRRPALPQPRALNGPGRRPASDYWLMLGYSKDMVNIARASPRPVADTLRTYRPPSAPSKWQGRHLARRWYNGADLKRRAPPRTAGGEVSSSAQNTQLQRNLAESWWSMEALRPHSRAGRRPGCLAKGQGTTRG